MSIKFVVHRPALLDRVDVVVNENRIATLELFDEELRRFLTILTLGQGTRIQVVKVDGGEFYAVNCYDLGRLTLRFCVTEKGAYALDRVLRTEEEIVLQDMRGAV